MSKKENSKGGRYLARKPRKGKGRLFVLILIFGVIGCIVGFLCFGPEQLAESEPSESLDGATRSESAVTTVPAATALLQETTEPLTEADPLADYRYIFELYRRAVSEKWDFIACEENNICYMIMFQENLSRLGYYLIDLNGDGQQELIISDGNVIYDLYAPVQGHIMWVLTGGERNTYQLTEDNRIINRGSNGASSFLYTVYSWDGAKLVNERSIFFDAMQDEPWVTTWGDNEEVLTEDEALALIESYQVIAIPGEPIS